jgi:hypothetical protein
MIEMSMTSGSTRTVVAIEATTAAAIAVNSA